MTHGAILHKTHGLLEAPDYETEDGRQVRFGWRESDSGKSLFLAALTPDAGFIGRITYKGGRPFPTQVRASSVIACYE